MGQQQKLLVAVLSAVLAALLLPQATCMSGGDDYAFAVSDLISAMQNTDVLGTAGTYQQLMMHKHSLSQGHLERSLVYLGKLTFKGPSPIVLAQTTNELRGYQVLGAAVRANSCQVVVGWWQRGSLGCTPSALQF